jgi:hypothetical protein
MPRDINRIWKRLFWRPKVGDIVKFSHRKSYYKVVDVTEWGVILIRLRRILSGWEGVEWKYVDYNSSEYDKMEVYEGVLV